MASGDSDNNALKIALRSLSYTTQFSMGDNFDSKLDGLHCAKASLGEQATDIIMLGLSRPISPTAEDTRALISEWESGDDVCCFHGSQEELLAQKDVYVLAISYKHDERSHWKRKGRNLESRMSQDDQDALVTCIIGLGLSPFINSVFIWCDRILSTRLDGRENSFGWYNAGLLPYLYLPVLTLTSYISDEHLESRIWIKAERTLGRLGNGILNPNDARLGLFSTRIGGVAKPTVLENVALMMLSGYWPADTGFWANAYQDMKKWALGLICRKQSRTELPLFDEIMTVDNMEILANLPELVMLPWGINEDEKPLFTDDSAFFLKATAWNLSLEEIWNYDRKYVSHYLGNLSSRGRFSWWTERTSQTIFGCFATLERACFVLAVRNQNRYKVFRREGNPLQYRHKEIRPGTETKLLIADVARKCHVNIEAEADWDLLYYSDDALDFHKTHPEVKAAMGDASSEADAIVPPELVGQTTSLFRVLSRMKSNDSSDSSEAVRFVRLFEEWNKYVKKTYKCNVAVRDTLSGPVWLEGYNEEHVSFGFLDMLTRNLIIGDQQVSDRVLLMPSKWDALKELRRVTDSSTEDLKLIEKELYGNVLEGNCESEVTIKEVAIFMICGAFTNTQVLTKDSQATG